MAWLEPGDVVDRLGERQPHVVVAVLGLDAQLDAVAVEAERSDVAAAQRCRQSVGESVDHLAVRGLEVLQPARLQGAERIGLGVEQGADADGLGAGRVGHHDGVDLEPHQGVGGVAAVGLVRAGIHLQQSRIRVLLGDQVEQAGHVGRRDVEQPAADPHQRAHRFAQGKRRVVGHLEHGLDARRARGDDHAGQQSVGGHRDGERAVVEQVVHRGRGRFERPRRPAWRRHRGRRRCGFARPSSVPPGPFLSSRRRSSRLPSVE